MLQPYTDGNSFRFNFYLVIIKILINITCRMSRSENNWSTENLFRPCETVYSLNADYTVAVCNQARHLRLEMDLTTTPQNCSAHLFNDTWQTVGTNMRMCIGENIRTGAMLTEYVQNFIHRAALFTARIQLSVAIR